MNASSLSGECARRNSVVFGIAAGVDILVTILNAHRVRTLGTLARPVRKFEKWPACGVPRPANVSMKTNRGYHTGPGLAYPLPGCLQSFLDRLVVFGGGVYEHA